MKGYTIVMAIVLGVFIPATAYADVVWPALYLEQRLLSWWAIALGLLIEYLFIRKVTSFGIRKSILADFVMNATSALYGIILIPLSGILLDFFAWVVLRDLLPKGWMGWGVECVGGIGAALLNAFIERKAIRKVFKFEFSQKQFWGLFLINVVTVGIAFVSLILFPPWLR